MGPTEYGVLVVGCGSIGSRHARNLRSIGVDDVTVFDTDHRKAEALSEELDVAEAASMEEAWDAGPDVTVVCVPNRYHVPVALEAAERDCHLFIEKPLSDSMDGVDELLEATERRDLRSMVGCNLRFHPAIRKMNELVSDGTVGRVIGARMEFGSYLPSWHPDEDYRESYSARADLGGGVILDHIHEIDYARWLLGEIAAVSAFTGHTSHLDIETEDTASVLVRFDSGAIGQLHLDYVQREYSRSCKIIGDDGTVHWEWDENVVTLRLPDGECHSHEVDDGWELNDTYVDEMEHFLDCVSHGNETRCPVEEGRADLEVALAAKESAATGKHVRLRTAPSSGGT